MESVLGRYRNLIVLVGVLFAQVLGLAVQVKRTTDMEPTRLIRVWAVGTVTPLEKVLVWAQTSTSNIWHNYFYLRGVRAENRALKAQIERMSLEQVRMSQDADQARRLQALLGFKEQFISRTMAAQVIGWSGSEQSRSVYIDKGEHDGLKPDMAVITAEGIVGKVLLVYRSTSLVLLINDHSSGVGALRVNPLAMRGPVLQQHGDGGGPAAIFSLSYVRHVQPNSSSFLGRRSGSAPQEKKQEQTENDPVYSRKESLQILRTSEARAPGR